MGSRDVDVVTIAHMTHTYDHEAGFAFKIILMNGLIIELISSHICTDTRL